MCCLQSHLLALTDPEGDTALGSSPWPPTVWVFYDGPCPRQQRIPAAIVTASCSRSHTRSHTRTLSNTLADDWVMGHKGARFFCVDIGGPPHVRCVSLSKSLKSSGLRLRRDDDISLMGSEALRLTHLSVTLEHGAPWPPGLVRGHCAQSSHFLAVSLRRGYLRTFQQKLKAVF